MIAVGLTVTGDGSAAKPLDVRPGVVLDRAVCSATPALRPTEVLDGVVARIGPSSGVRIASPIAVANAASAAATDINNPHDVVGLLAAQQTSAGITMARWGLSGLAATLVCNTPRYSGNTPKITGIVTSISQSRGDCSGCDDAECAGRLVSPEQLMPALVCSTGEFEVGNHSLYGLVVKAHNRAGLCEARVAPVSALVATSIPGQPNALTTRNGKLYVAPPPSAIAEICSSTPIAADNTKPIFGIQDCRVVQFNIVPPAAQTIVGDNASISQTSPFAVLVADEGGLVRGSGGVAIDTCNMPTIAGSPLRYVLGESVGTACQAVKAPISGLVSNNANNGLSIGTDGGLFAGSASLCGQLATAIPATTDASSTTRFLALDCKGYNAAQMRGAIFPAATPQDCTAPLEALAWTPSGWRKTSPDYKILHVATSQTVSADQADQIIIRSPGVTLTLVAPTQACSTKVLDVKNGTSGAVDIVGKIDETQQTLSMVGNNVFNTGRGENIYLLWDSAANTYWLK